MSKESEKNKKKQKQKYKPLRDRDYHCSNLQSNRYSYSKQFLFLYKFSEIFPLCILLKSISMIPLIHGNSFELNCQKYENKSLFQELLNNSSSLENLPSLYIDMHDSEEKQLRTKPSNCKTNKISTLDPQFNQCLSYCRQESKSGQVQKRQKRQHQSAQQQKEKQAEDETKNLLITIRNIMLKRIIKKFPLSSQTSTIHDFLNEMKAAKCVSKQMFRKLLTYEQLRQIISKMFDSRYIQRQLMLSRSTLTTRCSYLKKVRIFRQVFIRRQFPRIR